jgi:hypothetical protein
MASNLELSDCGHGKPSSQPLDPSDETRTTSQLRTQRAGQNTVLNQYERLKKIGTGQHGEVYVAWDNLASKYVVSGRSSIHVVLHLLSCSRRLSRE